MTPNLKYFFCRITNLGDAMNAWLWPHVFPQLDVHAEPDENAQETVISGIGTILYRSMPDKWQIRVLGSGAGYGPAPLAGDLRYKYYAVRGPVTAAILGLEPSLAISDPAILVPRYFQPAQDAETTPIACTWMPHAVNADYNQEAWRKVCGRLGIRYLLPLEPLDVQLDVLSRTQLLITESLHGAILADAFRVPWIPVQCAQYFLLQKWVDWTLAHQITRFEALPLAMPGLSKPEAIQDRRKFGLNPRKSLSQEQCIDWCTEELGRIQTMARPYLSKDGVVRDCQDRLLLAADGLKRDEGLL